MAGEPVRGLVSYITERARAMLRHVPASQEKRFMVDVPNGPTTVRRLAGTFAGVLICLTLLPGAGSVQAVAAGPTTGPAKPAAGGRDEPIREGPAVLSPA